MAEPEGIRPEERTQDEVMFYDTDVGGVVHNLAYLRMIERCRTRLAGQLGFDLRSMAQTQVYPVVVRTEIDYRRPGWGICWRPGAGSTPGGVSASGVPSRCGVPRTGPSSSPAGNNLPWSRCPKENPLGWNDLRVGIAPAILDGILASEHLGPV